MKNLSEQLVMANDWVESNLNGLKMSQYKMDITQPVHI